MLKSTSLLLPSGVFERLCGAVSLDLRLMSGVDGSPEDELAKEDAQGGVPDERGGVPVGPLNPPCPHTHLPNPGPATTLAGASGDDRNQAAEHYLSLS